ncbi:MAG: hypothetical protein J6U97_03090, partial [Bacteroidaceae bacterium]|nr:hypothetical protein [Bacteroidaceae bacterium]
PAEPVYPALRQITTAETFAQMHKDDLEITSTGSLTVGTSDNRSSDVYALRMMTSGRTLSQSGDISLYSNAAATVYGVYFSGTEKTLLVGGTETGVTVNNSASIAVGIYGNKLTTGYLEGADKYTVDVASTSSTAYGLQVSEFTEDFTWDVTVSTSGTAYGIQKSSIVFDKDFAGTINLTKNSTNAYGIYGTVTINGDFSGQITASTNKDYATVYGISGVTKIAGDYTGAISVSATSNYSYASYGFSGGLSIGGDFTGTVYSRNNSYHTGANAAYGIAGGLTVGGNYNGTVTAQSGSQDAAYGITGTISIGKDFVGEVNVTAGNTTYGLSSSNITIGGDLKGKIISSTTGSNAAYGISGSELLNIGGSFTGEITANSTGATDGIYLYNSQDNANTSAVLNIVEDFAGKISSTSTNGTAYGIDIRKYRKGRAEMTVGGDFTGSITVQGKSGAYGINVVQSDKDVTAALGIEGTLSGDITVGASNGNAYGIYVYGATGALSIGNGISGDILVSADGSISYGYGIYSTSYIYGKEFDEALNISGNILVNGRNIASSRAISSDYLNISVSGTLYAGSYHNSFAYGLTHEEAMQELQTALLNYHTDQKIYEELYNSASNGTVTGGSGDDKVTLLSGGEVWGNITLGTGANTLTLHNGSNVFGDIKSSNEGTLAVKYVLSGAAQKNAIIQSVDVSALDDENTSYSLDLTNIEIGQYILVSAEVLNALEGRTFSVISGESTAEITVDGEIITLGNGLKASLVVADGANT